jgi:cell wall-associated NlpC family hydrolase
MSLSQLVLELEKDTLRNKLISLGVPHLGKEYVYGASSTRTDVFDCSSFTQYLFKQIGIDLPRNSRQQSVVGDIVSSRSSEDMKTGDLVFFANTSGKQRKDVVDHVAIYIEGGYLLHTIPNTGVDFKHVNSYWVSKHVGTRRII